MYISAQTYKQWLDENKPHQLIDIREQYEIESCTLNGQPIAMAEILNNLNEIQKGDVVIHCNSGKRSDAVVFALRQKLQRNDIHSLEGGIQNFVGLYLPEQNCAS
jgi:adenylyltransferase/sulfurtransferase